MPEKGKRRLAAIMFADMVGYTALMQEDEERARQQRDKHRALISPAVMSFVKPYLDLFFFMSLMTMLIFKGMPM